MRKLKDFEKREFIDIIKNNHYLNFLAHRSRDQFRQAV